MSYIINIATDQFVPCFDDGTAFTLGTFSSKEIAEQWAKENIPNHILYEIVPVFEPNQFQIRYSEIMKLK